MHPYPFHSSTCLSILIWIYPPVHSFIPHLLTCCFPNVNICPSVHPHTHPCILLYSLTNPPTLCLFISLPTQSSLISHSSVHLSFHSYSLPSIHLLIHFLSLSFQLSFTHLLPCTLCLRLHPIISPQHSCPSTSLAALCVKPGLPG